MSKFEIGTLCKVKNQNIIGVIKENYGKSVVIKDEDSEFIDNLLEFKISEIEEVNNENW